jgi:hypothetical protein
LAHSTPLIHNYKMECVIRFNYTNSNILKLGSTVYNYY